MAKHEMNSTELRQRIRNLRGIRDGLKFEVSHQEDELRKVKIERIKLKLDAELRDVRSVYYHRSNQEGKGKRAFI